MPKGYNMISPPKRIVDLLGAIESENRAGTFAIELYLRPEVFRTVTNFVKEHFQIFGGDLHDILSLESFVKNLPNDVSFETAEARSSELQFGIEDGKTRRFLYRHVNNQTQLLLEISSEKGKSDTIPLLNLDQPTFAILASLYAAPWISIGAKKRKIGILFDGSTFDLKNWTCLIDYLEEISATNNLSVFMLTFTGKPGTNTALYTENVNRIGVYVPGLFTQTNSYKRSVEIINRMVSSIKYSTPRIPLLTFLGGGTSLESGLPRTTDLMANALKRLLCKPEEFDVDFENLIAEFRAKIVSDNLFLNGEDKENLEITFERIMTEELRHCSHMSESPTLHELKKMITEKSPSIAHSNLAKLVRSVNKPIFMTTNYDDFIERSLEGFGSVKTFYKDSDFADTKKCIQDYLTKEDADIPVFKFHGTIKDFDSIKASVQHTISLEPNKNVFWTKILNGDLLKEMISDFGDATIKIVFIGYGFNDPDIRSILRSVQKSGSRLHLYSANPNQSASKLLLESIVTSQGDMNNLISLPFSIFSEKLSSVSLTNE